jgi:hypothetical protein
MAFDKDDTDKIYDRAIKPCLRSLSIKPVRIDREEHNDDIDDKIIEELERASFAIADLTYARPSVYFEAGYADREIPVIYTCRSDHFRPKPDDEHGNLRVHFDLQMKNIIGWKDDAHHAFSKRLSKRIKKVIAPILRSHRNEEEQSAEAEHFQSLSLKAQHSQILETLMKELRAAGYKPYQGHRANWAGCIFSRRHIKFATAFVPQRATVSDLGYMVHFYASEAVSAFLRSKFDNSQRDLYSQKKIILPPVSNDVFICSTASVPHSRVSNAFPNFNYDPTNNNFNGHQPLSVSWRAETSRMDTRIHVLGNVKSTTRFRDDLRARVLRVKKLEPGY